MSVDEDAGTITFDQDLIVQVPPPHEVTMAERGPVFKSLRVNGLQPTEAVLNLTGPVPIIEIMREMPGPQPGLIPIELHNGKVTAIRPFDPGDWVDARESLSMVGLFDEGEVLWPMEEVPEGFAASSEVRYDELGINRPAQRQRFVPDEEWDYGKELNEALGIKGVKFDLGAYATPEIRQQAKDVVLGLFGSGEGPGSIVMVPVDKLVPTQNWTLATAKEHQRKGVQDMADKMKRMGPQAFWQNPEVKGSFDAVFIHWSNPKGKPMIADGAHRLEAAKLLGETHVPVRIVGSFSRGKWRPTPKEAKIREELGLPPSTPVGRFAAFRERFGDLPPKIWEAIEGVTTAEIYEWNGAQYQPNMHTLGATTVYGAPVKQIVLNERAMASRWTRGVSDPPRPRWFNQPEGTTEFERIFVHEIGHFLRDNSGYSDFDLSSVDPSPIAVRNMTVGKYAASDHAEYIAEVFVRAVYDPGKLTSEQADMITKMLDGVRNGPIPGVDY
jgi:hypothetical protein